MTIEEKWAALESHIRAYCLSHAEDEKAALTAARGLVLEAFRLGAETGGMLCRACGNHRLLDEHRHRRGCPIPLLRAGLKKLGK